MALPVFLPPLLSSASCRTKPQKQNDTGVRGYIHIRGRGRREVSCQHPRQPLVCRAAEQPSTAERQSGGSRTSWQPSLSFLSPSLCACVYRARWHILQSSSVCMRENVCVCASRAPFLRSSSVCRERNGTGGYIQELGGMFLNPPSVCMRDF